MFPLSKSGQQPRSGQSSRGFRYLRADYRHRDFASGEINGDPEKSLGLSGKLDGNCMLPSNASHYIAPRVRDGENPMRKVKSPKSLSWEFVNPGFRLA